MLLKKRLQKYINFHGLEFVSKLNASEPGRKKKLKDYSKLPKIDYSKL